MSGHKRGNKKKNSKIAPTLQNEEVSEINVKSIQKLIEEQTSLSDILQSFSRQTTSSSAKNVPKNEKLKPILKSPLATPRPRSIKPPLTALTFYEQPKTKRPSSANVKHPLFKPLSPLIKKPLPPISNNKILLRTFSTKSVTKVATKTKNPEPSTRPSTANKDPQPIVNFCSKQVALKRAKAEVNLVDQLEAAKKYEEAPIWLTFTLWQYENNLKQLKKMMKMGVAESCGNEIADMRHLFVYHGMSSCLDCFMIDEECNMRTIGYIIDDDVLVSFNTILPYMTQYFPEFLERFYGKNAEQNALIRQWISYCVRNIRQRRISEFMWQEMEVHVGKSGFFGGTYRTMADTLLYLTLYPYMKRWTRLDFAKRYNLARWFRLMQADDKLRGGNTLLKIRRTSEFHPSYPFYGRLPDPVEPHVLLNG